MADSSLSQHFLDEEAQQQQSRKSPHNPKKLPIVPLIFLIYFEVSGGPYGAELAVGAVGPLLALLGYTIFPFIWSVPEGLITAELATAFPGNGGYVIWAHEAFGPFIGSLMGSLKFFSGVIYLASYPVLCMDYLKLIVPVLSSGLLHYLSILFITFVLSFLNYTGLAVVGYTAVTLALLSILPFILLIFISIPKIHPIRWTSLGVRKKDWTLFFNTLFWSLNTCDNASTLAGEVDQPQKTYPKALLYAGLICSLAYLLPVLAATGAVPLEQREWTDGYFAKVAETVAGKPLKDFLETGAVLSIIGLYEATLTSCSYQLMGMAELGFVPRCFGVRSRRFDTPWLGILVSTLITCALSHLNLSDLISSANFLYSLGMLIEFGSFVRLRWKLPEAKRPFKVPMGLPGVVAMCVLPCGFLVYVMAVANETTYVISALLTLLAVAWYFAMNKCKKLSVG